jgi:hypothetical protein
MERCLANVNDLHDLALLIRFNFGLGLLCGPFLGYENKGWKGLTEIRDRLGPPKLVVAHVFLLFPADNLSLLLETDFSDESTHCAR